MLKDLNKTEKAIAGLITVTLLFLLIQIVRWIKH